MPKIKIRCSVPTLTVRSDMLGVLENFSVRCSRLIEHERGGQGRDYSVVCHSDLDADNMFSGPCLAALEALNCVPLMPAYLKSKRSVICLLYTSDAADE